MPTQIKSAARALLMASLVAATAFSAACDLNEVLAVDIPGKVDAESLNDPALASVLVNSVVGDAECAWSNYAAAASHHSDEWIPTSGNLNMREWGQRKMELQALSGGVLATGSCASNYGVYTPLQTARFLNNDVFEKLAAFDAGDVPDKAKMQGTVRAYGGWALLALGEGFCSMALDGGAEMQPDQVLGAAAQNFSEAISGTGDAALIASSYAGLARAKLDMGDWTGAMSDAGRVPEGFKFGADRAADLDRRQNYLHRWLNDTNDGISKHGSVADHFRELTVSDAGELTQSDGTADTRVPVETIGNQAFDFSTIHYYTNKYTSRADAAPMASWEGAQLIIAEAAAQLGDLATAVEIINALRAKAGLPEWGRRRVGFPAGRDRRGSRRAVARTVRRTGMALQRHAAVPWHPAADIVSRGAGFDSPRRTGSDGRGVRPGHVLGAAPGRDQRKREHHEVAGGPRGEKQERGRASHGARPR